MKLFVDDCRPAPEGWTLAVSITEALKILATQKVEYLSLDHDIEHWDLPEGALIANPKGTCIEDYSAIAWAISMMPEDRVPDIITVHSAWVDAHDKIRSILLHSQPTIVVKKVRYVVNAMGGPTLEDV